MSKEQNSSKPKMVKKRSVVFELFSCLDEPYVGIASGDCDELTSILGEENMLRRVSGRGEQYPPICA